MSNNPNTLFRIFPASFDGPLEIEGSDFNNIEDQRAAFNDSGADEYIVTRQQLEDARNVLSQNAAPNTAFGFDTMNQCVVNMGVCDHGPIVDYWTQARMDGVLYSFDQAGGQLIFGMC